MKHVVMFSGGASSAVMAKMVANRYPENTILLYNPTGAEHPDADRFRKEVADFIGLPVTVESAKKTLWEMVENYKYIPNSSIPYCTMELKIKMQDRFLKRLEKAGEKFIIYVGLGFDEWRRIQNVWARNRSQGRIVEFPLFHAELTSEDCKRIIRDEWKICLPEPYKYLKHNNCIPCYRGGRGHWFKVWKYYPEEFWRAAAAERRAENTVFQGISLDELAVTWEKEPEQLELFGEEETIPCMCAS